ncbi:glycosyl transferase family 2 [Paludibacter propionicigenes WB4]|uniref:Glycosyl transferase family 2 n=1 Tax=Paludibacter propionicigenes (strain DSM 17365 / JCM 13257 / WB4) TaxID=694427 RepID=E4T3I8_PALPW|nr:glycosyltransferase [Paludibacter propionicigenes]ADQ79282.1 glycosyl transferase family 2 [Paludibacter propionicigenes WB4]
MFVSIIIPVYNVEQYLRDCLISVVAQTYPDYEVICVNDGSTDGSLVILEEFRKKYNKISVISQQNKGLSVARNAGIQAAKGDYLFFLDSDDWIEPKTLEILVQKQCGEDLVCFNGCRVFEDGRTEEPDSGIEEALLTGWEYYCKYALVRRKFHFVCSVLRLYRREYLLEHKLFFEEGIYHEDNLFTPLACYYAQTVKVIPDCLYVYRIRQGSITQSVNLQRLYDMITVANKLSAFFILINSIDKSQLYREIAGEYFGAFTSNNAKLFGNKDAEIKRRINWQSFKKVSVYHRHRRIYILLTFHPLLFRMYMGLESLLKYLIRLF